MNLILDDVELNKILNREQLRALERLRNWSLKLHCHTMNDSLVMSACNVLPLLISTRGIVWAKNELERIDRLLVGESDDKRAVRRATKELLKLLK